MNATVPGSPERAPFLSRLTPASYGRWKTAAGRTRREPRPASSWPTLTWLPAILTTKDLIASL
jgi:hypothetical protein